MYIDEQQFKTVTNELGFLSHADIEKIAGEALGRGVSLSTHLVSTGTLNAHDVRCIEGHILNIPFVNLINKRIPFTILEKIPEPIAREHHLVVFDQNDTTISVATLSVEALEHINFLKEKLGLIIKPHFTDYESIKSVLIQYQKELIRRFGQNISTYVADIKKNKVIELNNDRQIIRELERQAEDASTAKLIEVILQHADLHSATDIHIEPQGDTISIKYRIGGVLRESLSIAKDVLVNMITRFKWLAKLPLLPAHSTTHGVINLNKIIGHVSFLPTVHGEKVRIRLAKENSNTTLGSVGFHGQSLENIEKVLHSRSGAILVFGEKGSGITTTLYALVHELSRASLHITTVENNTSQILPFATQLLMRPKLGFNIYSGVRGALKGDSEVIMVDSIDSAKTARLVLQGATFGRLMISGATAKSAIDGLLDLVDSGVSPFLIQNSVKLIIGTKLLKALPESREKFYLERSEIKTLGKMINLDVMLDILKSENLVSSTDTWETIPFYRPKHGSQSSHMVGIQEVIPLSYGLANAICFGADRETLENIIRDSGSLSLFADGLIKAVRGDVALADILKLVA